MKCGVIWFKFATPTPPLSQATHTDIRSNLSLMTSMQLPSHQIISYICHPTDVRAPAASYILFMTILIICLCADLSVTVAPLLHIVRSTPGTIHHLLYYYELCISLMYETVHGCVVLQVGCVDYSRGMLMDVSAAASWQRFILWWLSIVMLFFRPRTCEQMYSTDTDITVKPPGGPWSHLTGINGRLLFSCSIQFHFRSVISNLLSLWAYCIHLRQHNISSKLNALVYNCQLYNLAILQLHYSVEK